MLYKYCELQNLSWEENQTIFKRYFYKYNNKRKEIKKLKTHEKHFLFCNMSILKDEEGKQAFDLTSIDEAWEYCFYKLVEVYHQNLNFDKPDKNHLGKIVDKETMKFDKTCFESYYTKWKKQLETKEGKYLGVIHTEFQKKLKDICSNYVCGKIKKEEYEYKTKKLYSTAFSIYYKVKLFFDGLTDKFIQLNVLGKDIIINIYSFAHILFRHYYPSLDDTKRSINDPLLFLDIKNLPNSLKEFLIKYFACNDASLDLSREYLLFSSKENKHIIWIKYKALDELNKNKGFELRTIYKCEEKKDLDKFNGLTKHTVDSDLSFYF